MRLTEAIQQACGQQLKQMKPVSGGDICEAYCGILENGGKVFLKVHENAKMLHAEALGLEWIASGGVETPTVLAVSPTDSLNGFLVLSWVEVSNPQLKDWESFGEQLAQLHSIKETHAGWNQNNFIGSLHQDNRPSKNWVAFFRDKRLMPQIKLAIDTQKASIHLSRRMEPFLRRLGERLSEPKCISRLHGDLWNGNVLFQNNTGPLFIDPAPYSGHREMDFAMMDLFGGFHPRAIAAYDDIYPLESGWRERIPIYQLYYLLVHVNIHGASWLSQVYDHLDQLE